ncbi:hypothetical protein [Actinomadura macrotermitis]|uniref:Uncharacterized protein n=1 Tax=Actinomadura macrotermitis TaxID=2585200 RepID=A0A7K0BZK8_9ACTN|nr:hypothetical protein [Actinomadura macrotermitis]MQY06617.1 hypothetical protein [Actinomadura macrotermitis]
MSTPLANPRRTKLSAWPSSGTREQDAQQATLPGETAQVPAEEEQVAS